MLNTVHVLFLAFNLVASTQSIADMSKRSVPRGSDSNIIAVAGQMSTVCAGTQLPAGFVITATTTNLAACGGFQNDIWTVTNTNGSAPGARYSVCLGQILPTGYVIISVSTNFGNCGGSTNDIWAIVNLNGEPRGTRFTVCSGQTIPTGWTVVGFTTVFGDCGSTTNDEETIVKQ